MKKKIYSKKKKEEKKNHQKNSLCFAILGICDLTRTLQSSPILKKKIRKISKQHLKEKKNLKKKKIAKKKAIFSVLPIEEKSL